MLFVFIASWNLWFECAFKRPIKISTAWCRKRATSALIY